MAELLRLLLLVLLPMCGVDRFQVTVLISCLVTPLPSLLLLMLVPVLLVLLVLR